MFLGFTRCALFPDSTVQRYKNIYKLPNLQAKLSKTKKYEQISNIISKKSHTIKENNRGQVVGKYRIVVVW